MSTSGWYSYPNHIPYPKFLTEITRDKIHHGLSEMKDNKELGEDNLITEMIKSGVEVVIICISKPKEFPKNRQMIYR